MDSQDTLPRLGFSHLTDRGVNDFCALLRNLTLLHENDEGFAGYLHTQLQSFVEQLIVDLKSYPALNRRQFENMLEQAYQQALRNEFNYAGTAEALIATERKNRDTVFQSAYVEFLQEQGVVSNDYIAGDAYFSQKSRLDRMYLALKRATEDAARNEIAQFEHMIVSSSLEDVSADIFGIFEECARGTHSAILSLDGPDVEKWYSALRAMRLPPTASAGSKHTVNAVNQMLARLEQTFRAQKHVNRVDLMEELYRLYTYTVQPVLEELPLQGSESLYANFLRTKGYTPDTPANANYLADKSTLDKEFKDTGHLTEEAAQHEIDCWDGVVFCQELQRHAHMMLAAFDSIWKDARVQQKRLSSERMKPKEIQEDFSYFFPPGENGEIYPGLRAAYKPNRFAKTLPRWRVQQQVDDMRHDYGDSFFAQHLGKLCETYRGRVLNALSKQPAKTIIDERMFSEITRSAQIVALMRCLPACTGEGDDVEAYFDRLGRKVSQSDYGEFLANVSGNRFPIPFDTYCYHQEEWRAAFNKQAEQQGNTNAASQITEYETFLAYCGLQIADFQTWTHVREAGESAVQDHAYRTLHRVTLNKQQLGIIAQRWEETRAQFGFDSADIRALMKRCSDAIGTKHAMYESEVHDMVVAEKEAALRDIQPDLFEKLQRVGFGQLWNQMERCPDYKQFLQDQRIVSATKCDVVDYLKDRRHLETEFREWAGANGIGDAAAQIEALRPFWQMISTSFLIDMYMHPIVAEQAQNLHGLRHLRN